jgi:predicted transcriptional regulator
MAMTLRLSPELDEAADKLAAEQHTSKHSLIVRAFEEFISREEKTRRVLGSIDETKRDYAETIRRLEDA